MIEERQTHFLKKIKKQAYYSQCSDVNHIRGEVIAHEHFQCVAWDIVKCLAQCPHCSGGIGAQQYSEAD